MYVTAGKVKCGDTCTSIPLDNPMPGPFPSCGMVLGIRLIVHVQVRVTHVCTCTCSFSLCFSEMFLPRTGLDLVLGG